MNDIRAYFAREGLTRSGDQRVLGGVCAGIGRRIGLAPWPTRLLFVLILMLVPGSQLLIYPVLWLLMPVEQPATAVAGWSEQSATTVAGWSQQPTAPAAPSQPAVPAAAA